MVRYELFAATAFVVLALIGCTDSPADQQTTPSPVPAPTATSTDAAQAAEPSSTATGPAEETRSTLVAPLRGTAEISYVRPATKTRGGLVVTTFKVKNTSAGPIAGLKLEEYWWDTSGNPVTGSSVRLKTPLKPGETATLTLETPRVSEMYQCNYRFSHAYGAVRAVVAKTLE